MQRGLGYCVRTLGCGCGESDSSHRVPQPGLMMVGGQVPSSHSQHWRRAWKPSVPDTCELHTLTHMRAPSHTVHASVTHLHDFLTTMPGLAKHVPAPKCTRLVEVQNLPSRPSTHVHKSQIEHMHAISIYADTQTYPPSAQLCVCSCE